MKLSLLLLCLSLSLSAFADGEGPGNASPALPKIEVGDKVAVLKDIVTYSETEVTGITLDGRYQTSLGTFTRDKLFTSRPGHCSEHLCSGDRISTTWDSTGYVFSALVPDKIIHNVYSFTTSQGWFKLRDLYGTQLKNIVPNPQKVELTYLDLTFQSKDLCKFENPEFAKVAFSKARNKVFKSPDTAKSIKKCKDEGFDYCLETKSPETFYKRDYIAEAIRDFLSPYRASIYYGVKVNGEVAGFKYGPASRRNLQDVSCEHAAKCLEDSFGKRLTSIKHYMKEYNCENI